MLRDLTARTVRPVMVPTYGLILSDATSLAIDSNSSSEETPIVALTMSKFPATDTVISGVAVFKAYY